MANPGSDQELSTEDLRLLFKLQRRIGEIIFAGLPDETMLRQVTDEVISACGADGGFLIRAEKDNPEFTVVTARHYRRGDIEKPEFEISRSMIREVIRKKQPVFIENSALIPKKQLSQSFQSLGVVSAMALPLRQDSPDAPFAVIYLDRQREGRHFRKSDQAMLGEILDWANQALAVAFENRTLRKGPAPAISPAVRAVMAGDSPEMAELAAFIEAAAKSEAGVLIRGETGTGKELVAQLLHRLGPSANGPFVAVNCAALPAELLESELFGHETGAFTGAKGRRIGRFQEAAGGTLLLDEIGDMPVQLQVKLLRVIETKRFAVLGGREMPFTARLLAATHQPLEKLIRDGRFRQDLYYRLAVLEFEIPPLRKRRSDIPALAAHFTALFAKRQGRPVPALSEAALRELTRRNYPGNVRELAHLIERAIVFSKGNVLERGDFKLAERSAAESEPGSLLSVTAYNQARHNLEMQFVDGLIQTHHGNVAAAAKAAGLSRGYLYELVKKHFPEMIATARPRR